MPIRRLLVYVSIVTPLPTHHQRDHGRHDFPPVIPVVSIQDKYSRTQHTKKSNLTDNDSLYGSSNLSDVTIVLPGQNLEDKGQKIFAHRIVLAAGSHGFRDYFADNPIEVRLTAC